ncbi:MAG TPA: dienelactone hydrolase family protein [Gemmatimonadales bacterium]|jgi:carboxymethylenebutenolidase|nr:dienelactone hydrolase family protein [Gemmatimonadales bacterium]
MDGKTVGRSGGRAVGLMSVVAAGAAVFLAVSPSARQPADIHSEYVKYLSGKDTVTAYIAYPERPQPAPAVIVIHEIFGMSDFIRQTTEQLAKDGFVAIAPDLLSRRGGTPATPDSARKVIATLNPDTVTQDLDATRRYLNTLRPVRANEIGIMGFCWGGGQSFRYATNTPELKAFVVCYGPSPNPADMAKIRAKGLGVYAENDARINAGLNDAAAAMRTAGKDYPYTVYPGVGHGFLRTREKPEVADSAWGAVIRFFRAQLKS